MTGDRGQVRLDIGPSSPLRVNKKTVAVLFGGTSGLGQATSERLADSGWTVEVASRATGVDVRDMTAVKGFLNQARSRHGHIDLVANFAGILQVGRLKDMKLGKVDEWVEQGVTVGCVMPRRADTPMRRNAFPDEDQGPNLKPNAEAIVELHQKNRAGIVKHVY